MNFTSANTAILRYSNLDYGEVMDPEEFEPFEATWLSKIAGIPQATRDYYRKMAAESGRYLIFVGIPHVLHRGALNVTMTALLQA